MYLCAPIAAFWNMRAQRCPPRSTGGDSKTQQLQKERRRVPSFATLGFAGALLFAVVGGALVAIYAAPDRLVPVPAPTVAPGQQGGGVERPRTDAVSQQEASATVVPTSRQ